MILTSLQLIARRSLSHWRLLAAVVIGVLLAVTIMAGSVIYFDSLRDLGLTRDLESQEPSSLDVLVESSDSPVNPARFAEHYGLVDSRLRSGMSQYVSDIHFGIRTDTFYYGGLVSDTGLKEPESTPANSELRRVFFATVRGLEERSTLVSGSWPAPRPRATGSELVIDAVVLADAAAKFDIVPGTVLKAVPYWDDRHSSVAVRVTGIINRTEPTATFWRIHDLGFGVENSSFTFASFFVPEGAFVTELGAHLPKMGADYYWLLDTDTGKIHASDVASLRGMLARTDTELRATADSYRQITSLPEVLDRFGTRLFFNRLPMFVVLILIVLVVIYYVITIASLLIDAQRAEIALMRSRGATSRQIVSVYALEAIFLAVLALAAGPFLALAGVALIGTVPLFSDLNEGSLLPVRLTWSVYRMAGVGALLSLLALLIPSLRAARVGLLQYRQGSARPARLPAFQRYYLDLALMGIVLFFFWQLSRQGSFVAVRLLGDVAVDQLVLAVPAMFLVAAGVILLRIFPPAMDWLGRLLSSRWLSGIASPALVLGLWQMARNPAHHARLSLLLILTAGLGVFAASFGGTLERSFSERVHYESGSDIRVVGFSQLRRGGTVDPLAALREVDGVSVVSPAFRNTASVTSQSSGGFVRVLGIDPTTFADVAWTRPDFFDGTLADSLAAIDSFDESGIALPNGAEYISVRVRPTQRRADVALIARISDSQGRFFSFLLGTLGPTSNADAVFPCSPGLQGDPIPWCRVGTSIVGNAADSNPWQPVPPLRLEAIGVTPFGRARLIQPGAVDLDDVSVHMRDGRQVAIEEFGAVADWNVLVKVDDAFADTIEPSHDASGVPIPGVARMAWSSGVTGHLRGASPGRIQPPIPALISKSLMEAGNYGVGDVIDLTVLQDSFSVRVAGIVSYFPTLDPDTGAFLVADVRTLASATSVGKAVEGLVPNEAWLGVSDGADRVAVVAGVRGVPLRIGEVVDRAADLDEAAVDPLVSAGWRALLAIAFVTVLVVSAIGFIVHAQVTFRARQTELALLRATGLSMRQLLALVTLEQLLVIGAGIAIGAFMGARLGATIMPYLGTSGAGIQIAPPMILEIDWGAVAITFGLVGVVFAAVIGVILFSVYRMSVHRVLRLGER